MRYVIATVLLLGITLGTSSAQQHKPDAMSAPQLLASVVHPADNGDGHLFAIHRERPEESPSNLRYSVMRYPILGGVVMPNPIRIWGIDVSDPLDQPGMRPSAIGAAIDISVDHDAVYAMITRSHYPEVY